MPGEIGGLFRREWSQPRYYGTRLDAALSLDEQLEINWSTPEPAYFYYGDPDGSYAEDNWQLGWFDDDHISPWPPKAYLRVRQDDNDFYVTAWMKDPFEDFSVPVKTDFAPGRHTFRFLYNPDEGDFGRLYARFDEGEQIVVDLPADWRLAGRTFDMFGLFNTQAGGGTEVYAYFDNLSFTAPAIAPLEGDLSGNGFVGDEDLDIIRSYWGQAVTPGNLLQGDPSGDGFVGGDDLDWVRTHWGQGTPPSQATPEPSAVVFSLQLSALAAILLRRRRVLRYPTRRRYSAGGIMPRSR